MPNDCSVRRHDAQESQSLKELLEPLGDFRNVTMPKNDQASQSDNDIQVSTRVSSRYLDGYILASATTATGRLIKFTGILLAISVITITPLLVNHKDGGITLIVCISIAGLMLGIIIYVVGILLAAFGQVIKAIFDQAVNSSPFLTHHQRALAMGLYHD